MDLKGNQETLHKDVSLFMSTEVISQDKKALQQKGLYERTIEKGHGRIETHECFICHDIDLLHGVSRWSGLSGIGVIASKGEEVGREVMATHNYFIYSLKDATAGELLQIKRSHWAIENNLHWNLYVTFPRARIENVAENLNILKKQALQLMKQETSVKGSMRSKRLRCAYDLSYALKVLAVN